MPNPNSTTNIGQLTRDAERIANQFGRKCQILLGNGQNAEMADESWQISLKTKGMDTIVPPTCEVSIYNLRDDVADRAIKEFQTVIVQAGYKYGNYGTIFAGTIKRVRKWKSGTDKILTIFGGDGDRAYQFGFVNQNFALGTTDTDQVKAIGKETAKYGLKIDTSNLLQGGVDQRLLRPALRYGLFSQHLTEIAKRNGKKWFIQNGTVKFMDANGYLPGAPVVLTPKTGLVGAPEATQQGINVTCLMNPFIGIGSLIQIDSKYINTTFVKQQQLNGPKDMAFFANVTADGLYRVLLAENEGTTRSDVWHTRLTCLAVDRSAPINKSVLF